MYFYVSLCHLLSLSSVVSYSTKANEILLIKACKGSWSLLPLKFAFLKQKTSGEAPQMLAITRTLNRSAWLGW